MPNNTSLRTEDYIRELVTIFFTRKKIILTTTVFITVCAVLIAFLWPPSYAVTGSILVKAKKLEKSPEALEQTQIRLFKLTKEDLASELELVIAPDLIEKTIVGLSKTTKYFQETVNDKDELTKAINMVSGAITTELLPNSNIIEVTFTDRDADFAQVLLKNHLQRYMEYRNQIFSPVQVTSFFEKQAKKFTHDLLEKEDSLAAIVQQSSSADPNQEISNNLLLQKDTERQLSDLNNSVLEKRRMLAHLLTSLDSDDIQLFSFVDNVAINEFSIKLQDQIIERQKKLRVFLPTSSKIRGYDGQIRNSLESLKNEVRSYADDMAVRLSIEEEKVTALTTQLETIRQRNIELNNLALKMQQIKRDIGLLKQSYEIFMKRWEEAKINATAETNSLFSISILGNPFFNGKPVFRNKMTLIPFGIIAGLFTGISLGFLREYFDHTVRKPEDISKYVDIPVLYSLSCRDK